MGSVAQSLKKSTNAMRSVILLTTLCLGLASSSPVGEQSRAFDKLVEAQENAKKLGATSKIAQIPFNVEERNDDYRVVQLPASMWVCTNTTIAIDEDPYDNWRQVHGTAIAALGANQDTVTSKMFKSLFQYIIGVNTKSAEIKMTAPVTNRVVDDDEAGTRLTEMCFWLGSAYNYQNLPPSPLSEDVYIQNRDPTTYFVRRFSGWALSNTDWESQLENLMVSLKDRVDQVDETTFFTVSFDSPFHNGADRRNEVWVPKKVGVSLVQSQIQKEKTEDLDYMVLEKTTEYELRRYGEERWACTTMDDVNPSMDPMNGWQKKYNNNPYKAMSERKNKSKDRPSNNMFMRMFKYIQGVNKDFKEIDMTIPVPTTHIPTSNGMENQQMCFWLGSQYRDEEPPQPVPGQNVVIKKQKGFEVYVREFGGWALSDNDYRVEYEKLAEDLNEVAESFDTSRWFHASYNSPFDQGPRRNEVWVPKA